MFPFKDRCEKQDQIGYYNQHRRSSEPDHSLRKMFTTLFLVFLLPVAEANIGTFLWVTDAHLDEFYGSSVANVHFAGAPCNRSDAPPYSAFGCGSNFALVNSAISAAANASVDVGFPNPDFILYTGDSVRHEAQKTNDPNGTVVSAIEYMPPLFAKYFPNIPVIQQPPMEIGNNDLPGGKPLGGHVGFGRTIDC